MDIVDTAVSAGNFTTLVAAIKAADLVETLKGAGPRGGSENLNSLDKWIFRATAA